MLERELAKIIMAEKGKLYRVGGCVRDELMGNEPQDIDYCIVGMVKKNFKTLFPAAIEVGKSFPVFRINIDGKSCEIAFARTERKVGSGYRGFKVASNPKITIEEDLKRRDTTINSMAKDCLTGEILDPYQGQADLAKKVLRATSTHFVEDPVRALRLASQAARFGFSIDPDTFALAKTMGVELALEPVERFLTELTKVLTQAAQPAEFLRILADLELLAITFPVLASLEKAEFTKLLERLDKVAILTAGQAKIRFATLGLSLSKEQLASWNQQMTLPSDWLNAANSLRQVALLLQQASAENYWQVLNSLRRGSLNIAEFMLINQGLGLSKLDFGLFQATLMNTTVPIPQELVGKEIQAYIKKYQIEILKTLIEKI